VNRKEINTGGKLGFQESVTQLQGNRAAGGCGQNNPIGNRLRGWLSGYRLRGYRLRGYGRGIHGVEGLIEQNASAVGILNPGFLAMARTLGRHGIPS